MLHNLPWIFFLAWTSHHLRDATRRGLWFGPFFSTPPLPSWMYIGLTMIMPLMLSVFLHENALSSQSFTHTDHV